VKDDLGLGLDRSRERLMNAFEELDRCDHRYGTRLLTGLVVARVRSDWMFIERQDPRRTLPQSLTGLNASLLALNAHIGDRSNLILDPDLDSYCLMDALVVKIPTAADLLGHVLVFAQQNAGGTAAGDEAQNQLVAMAGLLRSNLDGINNDFRVAFDNAPALARKLEPLRREVEVRTQTILDLIDSKATANGKGGGNHRDLLVPALAAFRADFSLYDQSSPALDNLLAERIGRVERSKWQAALAIGMLGLASIGVIVFLFLRVGAGESQPLIGT
jgi:hypothetical protein